MVWSTKCLQTPTNVYAVLIFHLNIKVGILSGIPINIENTRLQTRTNVYAVLIFSLKLLSIKFLLSGIATPELPSVFITGFTTFTPD